MASGTNAGPWPGTTMSASASTRCRAADSADRSTATASPVEVARFHGVGERDHAVGRAGQRGDVLAGVSRRADEPDRRRQLVPLGLPVVPAVALVDRPVVVEARVREQRGVERVVRMVVAEHDVGHVLGRHTQRAQRIQDQRAVAHHAGIGHHDDVAVADEPDGGGDAGAPVPLVQDGVRGGARQRFLVHARSVPRAAVPRQRFSRQDSRPRRARAGPGAGRGRCRPPRTTVVRTASTSAGDGAPRNESPGSSSTSSPVASRSSPCSTGRRRPRSVRTAPERVCAGARRHRLSRGGRG